MSAQATPMQFTPVLAEEDQARADYYALLARLYYAAPDAALLQAIAGAAEIAGETDISLSETWRALKAVSAVADTQTVRDEYDTVFVGTGKSPVTLYSSHYLADSTKERVLVRLRDELTGLGLVRNPGVAEYEDHLAGLCEVMRHLVLVGSSNAALQKQKLFFTRYIGEWYAKFCEDVLIHDFPFFYKHVARFTRAFFDVEKQSFSML